MTVPAWPTTLPRPERSTFQMTPAEARLKRRADAGAPAYRLRFSGVPKLVTMSILVTRAGKSVFDLFHQNDTRWGSLPFTMPDPTTEGWPMTDAAGNPLLDGAGNPLLMSGTWLCMFGEQPPVETIVGVRFRKTFNIVVLP
ncbi:hypothetical protein [Rhizobium leguminosarum]|jgi:hypothetical protein|uniref:hypothetical protein n=1 Tax=Rhizobium leguminosarum TaxID=384 RepID=UPI001C91418E|nr:hypothetical protein [Rhizobium leguminosarum]MBY2950512.1 hypothetical protein [Rhizobium leguminosarum]